MREIIIKGARQHNLKNISLKLPRDKLIVITGLSGSGKSSLAFDTLYAEGQRRYVESLSSYARQFLGLMDKPDVDSIEGLSPAISIEQKTTSKNPRSTVGTVTEIYDYLRLLYARIGDAHCPNCKKLVSEQTPENIAEHILNEFHGQEAIILVPIIRQKKGTYERLISELGQEGYSRVRVDGKIIRTDENIKLQRYVKHDIQAVQDRITLNKENQSRLIEAIEQSINRSGGLVQFLIKDKEVTHSTQNACSECNITLEELQPRMFSFNSPFGACEQCHGLGIIMQIDENLVIPDNTISLADGAISFFKGAWQSYRLSQMQKGSLRVDVFKPFNKLTKKERDYVLYGGGRWEGVVPMMQRLHQQSDSERIKMKIQEYMIEKPCPKCQGKRLKDTVLAVTISNKNIIEITDLSIQQAFEFFTSLKLSGNKEKIAAPILKELTSRLKFLIDVGLDYLTLSRRAGSLSGGEAQRIRLATQIGSKLMGVMYILDEPSIGLHQRDNQKLINTLIELRDLGNTVIVVEHDEDTMLSADYLLDIGPGAGVNGGRIVAFGTPEEVKRSNSITGQYLSGKKKIEVPKTRRKPQDFLQILGCEENNLKNIDVKIPTGVLCCITGVSGSGKSTLINQTLKKALQKKLTNARIIPGAHKKLLIPKSIKKVIAIDQSPIGRTPRSNPATYTKVFDDIRQLFANTKQSKTKGFKPGRFSFNVKGGRCENCRGDGVIKIEMNFLPDIYVHCEACEGKRYNKETLKITYNEKNIAEVLDMTVEEAHSFFSEIPSIKRKLKTLIDVGLGYIKLGQSSTTLSGGEAQRIKLTKELSKKTSGDTIYILDEPTTGLHFEDVKKLLSVLNRLVNKKNTVLVIEHNMDVIKSADWIIDLGPEGGDKGGEIVAFGTPEDISKNKNSHTGKYLKKILG